jgi:hypothetical protein
MRNNILIAMRSGCADRVGAPRRGVAQETVRRRGYRLVLMDDAPLQ